MIITEPGRPPQRALTQGLCAQNFRRIADHGFGDPYNAYPHSMAWFKGHLYVGATRACLAHRGRWRAGAGIPMGQVWPVRIPEGPFDIDLRAQIWRYHPPTDTWTQVYISPMVKGIDGFDVPRVTVFRCMITFQGQSDREPALYAPAMGSHQTPDALLVRSTDGETFEVVSEPGMGFPEEHRPRGVRALEAFKGKLFTAPAAGREKHQPNAGSPMVIAATEDPANGKWQIVCQPHFGDPNNQSVFSLAAFNAYLYAGTLNVAEGFQVWKTDAKGDPPYRWTRVLTNGAYRGPLNQVAMTMQAFGDHLFVGSGIQEGGWDRTNKVGPDAVEIIRVNRDDTWDLVVGSPRLTPEGLKVPLSGLGPGFDKVSAGYLWSMCVHDNWLYAGTFDWLVFLRYSKGEGLPAHLQTALPPERLEQIIADHGGFSFWRTSDGAHWFPVSQNGLGNSFNSGIRSMVSSPHGLFIGAANAFGPEVAVQRVAGWQYTKNPRSGLEIWLGTAHGQRAAAAEPAPPGQGPARVIDDLEDLVDDFFSGSGYRHFGFWTAGMAGAREACENLIEELLAFLPERTGKLLEIGCGSGASTRHLLRCFAPASVVATTADRSMVDVCRRNAPGAAILRSKPSRIQEPSASFDYVVWIRGLEVNPPAPRDLREAYRVLKPTGRLVCFELLPAAAGAAELGVRLRQAGFRGVQVHDATSATVGAFGRHRAKYLAVKALSGEIGADLKREADRYFQTAEAAAGCAVFITAEMTESAAARGSPAAPAKKP